MNDVLVFSVVPPALAQVRESRTKTARCDLEPGLLGEYVILAFLLLCFLFVFCPQTNTHLSVHLFGHVTDCLSDCLNRRELHNFGAD